MAQDTGQATVVDPIPSIEAETIDRIFRALADAKRRAAVSFLADVDRAVTRDELVHHVTVVTAGCGAVDGLQRERLSAEFHHNHLPKLAAAGFVDYDDERAVVYPTDRTDRVSQWIVGT